MVAILAGVVIITIDLKLKNFAGLTCGMKINCPMNCTSEIQGTCDVSGKCICKDSYTTESCSEKIPPPPPPSSASTNSTEGQSAFAKELARLQRVANRLEDQYAVSDSNKQKLDNIASNRTGTNSSSNATILGKKTSKIINLYLSKSVYEWLLRTWNM